MSNILAIDTTTEACSVALMVDNYIFPEKFIVSPFEHTKFILPMINDLLTKYNIPLHKLHALAFGCGPGSFIGVRIGKCIAQAISLSTDIKIIEVSTLAALAERVWKKTKINHVLVSINANMKEVYLGEYIRTELGHWFCQNNESIISITELNNLFINKKMDNYAIAGSGWQQYKKIDNKNLLQKFNVTDIILPHAKDILTIAIQNLSK